MATSHAFETSVSWTGAREGKLESEGLPSLDVASPPAFSGTAGRWTPEHFFVASAELCVMLTFVAIAELSKLAVKGYRSSAKGILEKGEGKGKGFRFTSVEIEARIQVEREADVERAQRLLEKAEASCLVSNSLETPVRVKAEIEVAG